MFVERIDVKSYFLMALIPDIGIKKTTCTYTVCTGNLN